jgi:hypothetical protein
MFWICCFKKISWPLKIDNQRGKKWFQINMTVYHPSTLYVWNFVFIKLYTFNEVFCVHNLKKKYYLFEMYSYMHFFHFHIFSVSKGHLRCVYEQVLLHMSILLVTLKWKSALNTTFKLIRTILEKTEIINKISVQGHENWDLLIQVTA